MKLVKYKFFFSWQFEERERWLNEMSAEGWQLEKFKFSVFWFKKSEPNEYIYRCQLLDTSLKSDSDDYIRFIEQTGAELVQRRGANACFRKKASEGLFELISDAGTRIRRLRNMMRFSGTIGIINISLGIFYLCLRIANKQVIPVNALTLFFILSFICSLHLLWCSIMCRIKYRKLKKQYDLFE